MTHRLLTTFTAAILLTSCSKELANVEVYNPRDFASENEIIEIPLNDGKYTKSYNNYEFIIIDSNGDEVPYQITSDGMLIFPVNIPANTTGKYSIRKGKPIEPDTLACGRFYPERHDDIAWESDKIGFRAYGPESERLGDKLYGYDIFLKRDTSAPMIKKWMDLNNSKEIHAQIDSLRKAGLKDEAKALSEAKSYHIDHGNGMDCYAVGPTLGAGTTAIMQADTIVYPWAFKTYEIIDNGPLRFSVALAFEPKVIGDETITERRLITLDAGKHLNFTKVMYDGLKSDKHIVTGIVLHDDSERVSSDAANRYIAYTDPTQGSDNGQLYVGAVFISNPDSVTVTRGQTPAQILAHNILKHNAEGQEAATFDYYWGAGWDRSDIPSWEAWQEYLAREVKMLDQPLQIKFTEK